MIDKDAVQRAVQDLLVAIGEDPQRQGLLGTPRRVAEMYAEILGGMDQDPEAFLEVGFDEAHEEMVVLRDIPFYSMCVPSRQLIDAVGGQKRAADVQPGTWLHTLVGGEVATTQVVAVSSRPVRELVRVGLPERPSIVVTPDHPIMTSAGWRPAAELQQGSLVEWVHPRRYNQRRYPVRVGHDLGYVLGALASDGSIQDRRRLCLTVRDRSFAERFAAAFGQAFGHTPQVERIEVPSGFLSRKVESFRVRVVSSHLASLMLRWFGCSGPQKGTKEFHLPRGVLTSREMTQGFLDGYIDGDGHVLPKTGRMIVSSNHRFLEELGEVVGSRPARQRDGMARLYVSDRWHQDGWYGRPGFSPAEETYDLRDSCYVPVSDVETVRAEGTKPYTVYTFACAPHPTFCISGVLTHNCEHHLLPFHGLAHVAYIPSGRVVGISKLARVVDCLARRPQLQERLTSQIADLIDRKLQPKGVAVVIQADHLCMTMRGIKKPGSRVVTSATRGVFRGNTATRMEFLSLLDGSRR